MALTNSALRYRINAHQEEEETDHPSTTPKSKPEMQNGAHKNETFPRPEQTPHNYNGFVNLALIVGGLSNFSLLLANIHSYGLRADWRFERFSFLLDYKYWPSTFLFFRLLVFPFLALVVEWLVDIYAIPESFIAFLQTVNILSLMLVASLGVAQNRDVIPPCGIVIMLLAMSFAMKLVSYAAVNRFERRKRRQSQKLKSDDTKMKTDEPKVKDDEEEDHKTAPSHALSEESCDKGCTLPSYVNGYPANLTVKSLTRYLVVPSLCYDIHYPVAPRVRPWVVLSLTSKFFLVCGLIYIIGDQFLFPGFKNTLPYFRTFRVPHLVVRVIRIAVPHIWIWILGFYALFYLLLNLFAELSRYPNRHFYSDWWNATTVGSYWRRWNYPVHQFTVEYVYLPATQHLGLPRNAAVCLCFLVSGLMHELAVSIPFRIFRVWCIFAMLGQVPMDKLTAPFRGTKIGNCMMWSQFVIGLPAISLLYFNAFYSRAFEDAAAS
mmetsp:Transcript_2823/g.4292  ORF Transcript_2823/g.4292 Transcript_2823/m.4292 type:complete len:491 (+) Transcript_2823:81-1553(+)|eukprot:CAMPEP_0184368826 /NCGR_PEP_ID=MMETSP1089-20130417/161892_1 /TAXON_ID=38269 ORGANISM="Gloeochaete wittrockiana, Strain SAG46.84" /NCGR_SAMPLE_ID=MMETSP1089 /ASSEMBLY_ACC=CAM_ASM_000445 /LENGTH=490 /DNA_ID=CAMNT_0026711181 /DNA_START=83 /DNA_END=1555 /DNA_ORIENTATION=-